MKNIGSRILLLLTFLLVVPVMARDKMCYERFATAEGLPSVRISSICEDADGTIWIATWNGICQWRNGTLTHVRATADGQHVGRVVQIQPLQDGTLSLLLDNGRGTRCFDPRKHIFRPVRDSVAVIGQRHHCRFREDVGGAHIERRGVTYHIPYDRGGSSEKLLRCHFEDSRGQIWLSFNNSLYRIWFETSPFCYFQDWMSGRHVAFQASVRAITTLADGRLLVGSRNGRLFGLNSRYTNVNGSIYDVVEDDRRRLWLSLRNEGLHVIDSTENVLPAVSDLAEVGLSKPFSLFLANDSRRLWVGTWDCGVRVLDIGQQPPVLVDTLHDELLMSVRHIFQTSNGSMVVCSTRGLYLFTPSGKLLFSSADDLNVLYAIELPSHDILFSTMDQGLFRMTVNGQCLPEHLPFEDRIVSMVWGHDSVLYLVADERIYLSHDVDASKYDVLDERDFGEVVTFSEGAAAIHNDSLLYVGASSGLLEVNLNQLPAYMQTRKEAKLTRTNRSILIILLVIAGLFLLAVVVWRIRALVMRAKALANKKTVTPEVEMSADDLRFIHDLKSVLAEMISQPDVDVAAVAKRMKMTKSALYGRCSGILNISPAALLKDMRIEYACKLIEEGNLPIRKIAAMVGFNDPKYFARAFKAKVGVLPSQYGGKLSQQVENSEK